MGKGSKITASLLSAVAIATAIAVSGCGGGGGAAPVGTLSRGVEAVASLTTTGRAASMGRISASMGPGELNVNYPNAFQVPSTYTVAITKMELLKGTDDTTPYLVFDTGSVESPMAITLTGTDSTKSFGENSEYPEPGAYTHMRITMVYQELTVNADVNDGNGYVAHKFRIYATTVGNVQDGDLLMDVDGTYNWIKGGGFYPVTGSRPDDSIQDRLVRHGYLASDESPDPYIFTGALATPLVVPDHPSGKYKIKATFDVSASPEVPGSTGIFMWDDVTQDGLFKPGIDMEQGGDCNATEFEANGAADWTPLSPTITFTYSQE